VYIADLGGDELPPIRGRSIEILESLISLGLSVGALNLPSSLVETSLPIVEAVETGQVKLLDPWTGLGDYRGSAYHIEARRRAFVALNAVDCYLDDQVVLADRSLRSGTQVSLRRMLWRRLRAGVQSKVVVVRERLSPYGSTAMWQESEGGSRVLSFQHGIVSGIHHHVPVLGSTHLTYGPTAAGLLSDFNKSLAATLAGRHAATVPVGNYIHRTDIRPDPLARKSLLILDQTKDWTNDYYGCEDGLQGLRDLAVWALRNGVVEQVTVRPHPFTASLGQWLRLQEESGASLRISHREIPLDFDLQNSLLTLSLFSGASLASAANRVPTLFLGNGGKPWTPELSAFAPLTVSHEEAEDLIESAFRQPEMRNRLAGESFAAAGRYFGSVDYRPLSAETLGEFM